MDRLFILDQFEAAIPDGRGEATLKQYLNITPEDAYKLRSFWVKDRKMGQIAILQFVELPVL